MRSIAFPATLVCIATIVAYANEPEPLGIEGSADDPVLLTNCAPSR